MQYVLKTLISALLIVLVSEISKRNLWLGGVLASLPITSVLAFVWIYRDTQDSRAVAELSTAILWLVLPSLVLFLLLPLLLKRQMPFYPALALSCLATALAYGGMMFLLKRLGILS